MTEQEKSEILDELEKRMEKKYGNGTSNTKGRYLLRPVFKKWFIDKNGTYAESPMGKKFPNSPVAVWQYIRKLTLQICNKRDVYHLEESDNADEIAERICQFIYDLKIEVKEDTEC